jgi:tRNA U34 2-thiouridine synthase MnmA/TrmU
MKIIIGLSGGVDSSVAAHILLEQGFEVEALFMKNWEEDDITQYIRIRRATLFMFLQKMRKYILPIIRRKINRM